MSFYGNIFNYNVVRKGTGANSVIVNNFDGDHDGNKAYADNSFVAGAFNVTGETSNTKVGENSFIAGGSNNIAKGKNSFVAGYGNTVGEENENAQQASGAFFVAGHSNEIPDRAVVGATALGYLCDPTRFTQILDSENEYEDKIIFAIGGGRGSQKHNVFEVSRKGKVFINIRDDDNGPQLVATQKWVKDKEYATQKWVEDKNYATQDALNNTKSELQETLSTKISREIITTLPTTGKQNVIYMFKDQYAIGEDKYKEYIYTNSGWEMIGDTSAKFTGPIVLNNMDNKAIGTDSVVTGSRTIAGNGMYSFSFSPEELEEVTLSNNTKVYRVNSIVLNNAEHDIISNDIVSCQFSNNYDGLTVLKVDGATITFGDENTTSPLLISEKDKFVSSGTLWTVKKSITKNTTKISGSYSFGSGYNNKVFGTCAVGFGNSNYSGGDYSFSAGNGNEVLSFCSFGLGNGNKIYNQQSFALGTKNIINAYYGTAIGYNNTVGAEGHRVITGNVKENASGAIAIGCDNNISHAWSQGLGTGLISGKEYQVLLGQYNASDQNASFIIGNGTNDNNRKNVIAIKNNNVELTGNLICAGDLSFSGFLKHSGSNIMTITKDSGIETLSLNFPNGNPLTITKQGQAYLGSADVINDDKAVATKKYVDDTAKNKILDYIEYEVTENNTVTITSCDTSISGSYIIPETIKGYPVTSIGAYAFRYCGLTSITIPDSVTNIDDDAFYACSSLKSVTIGNNVTSIGNSAFCECVRLTSVTIGNSVESIGESAFTNCTSLQSVTIPDSVISIDDYAFYYCPSLQSVIIPDSITSIGEAAFSGCSSLTDVWYEGTREQWNNITIEEYNFPPTITTIHYKYGEVPTPIEDTDAANKKYVDDKIKEIKPTTDNRPTYIVQFIAKDSNNQKIRYEVQYVKEGDCIIQPATTFLPTPINTEFIGWDREPAEPITSNMDFRAIYRQLIV